MTSVAALIQAVHEAGGRLHPIGDHRLKVRAPHPLDEGLISELRAHKPAVLAFLADQRTAAALPATWIAGVARLIGTDPSPGYSKDRWRVPLWLPVMTPRAIVPGQYLDPAEDGQTAEAPLWQREGAT